MLIATADTTAFADSLNPYSPSAWRLTGGNTGKSIADNLSKAGWSYGYGSALDRKGRTIWIVDARGDNGKHFVVSAGERWRRFWNSNLRFALSPPAFRCMNAGDRSER